MNRSPSSVWLLTLLTVGLLAVLYLLVSESGVLGLWDPGVEVDPGSTEAENPRSSSNESGAESEATSGEKRTRVKTGTGVEPATVRYRLVDGLSGAPVSGGRICRAADAKVLAVTDASGYALVTGVGLLRLVFAAEGYLLDHYFDRGKAAEKLAVETERLGYVRVPLEPDHFTVPFCLAFMGVDRSPAGDVQFQIRCLEEPPPAGGSVPTARIGLGAVIDQKLRDAWKRHFRMSQILELESNPGLCHFGVDSDHRQYRAKDEALMRFVAPGYYAIEATSGDEFTDRIFEVSLGQTSARVIRLEAGRFFSARLVSSTDGRPVVGAAIVLRQERRVIEAGESDQRGEFSLGPRGSEPVQMEIRHLTYRPLTLKPVRPGREIRVLKLTPLPLQQLRGVVRSRPDLAPIAGASVRLELDGKVLARGRTTSDGAFLLKAPLPEPTLKIEAKGFLAYVELVQTQTRGPIQNYDLLPATPEARVKAGLSALLKGRVFKKDGKPAARQPVHLRPEKRPVLQGMSGRRILEGGVLVLPQTVITNEVGEFEIEWMQAGPVRLLVPRGLADPGQGQSQGQSQYLNVVLGTRREKIELRPGR